MANEDGVQLRIDDVCLRFGAVKALDGISLDVKPHQLLAIIGPNGAGKTCLFNVINGFYRPQEGEVYFEGQRITQLPPYKIAELGISEPSSLSNSTTGFRLWTI